MSEHIPTTVQEIERKTIETVESLISRHEKGLIGEAQFYEGMNAVWGLSSGIVSKDLMNLISDAIPSEQIVNHQVFAKGEGGKAVILSHDTFNGGLEVLDVEVKSRRVVSHDGDTEQTAAMLQTLRKRLKESKWEQL